MKDTTTLLLSLVLLIGCKEINNTQEPELITSRLSCAPITSDNKWYDTDHKAPLFKGLGDLHFPISTKNELAQKYFDQGLVLAYGFNHAEAARSFYYASKLDPNCAMAFWGFAYILGPNYNASMDSANYKKAYEAIQKALSLSKENTTEIEKGLIEALATRYVNEPIADRFPLDVDYSEAMEKLFHKFPNSADVGTLYAESLMNLHPWDLFDTSTGKAKEWTPKILSVLEHLIEKYPEHCGANHYYIHAVESSKTPEKALQSAQLFYEGLVPNAGHLVHMPSHIYIRTGDYHKGTLANIKAIKADSTYVTSCHAQGTYPLTYFPHNQHFMAATATLEGNSKWALYAADEVAKNANQQLMNEPGWGTLQHYYSIPFYVYVKFGKWDDILRMRNKVPKLPYPTALLHYAKGMAYLGKGKIGLAKKELDSLTRQAANDELKNVTIWDINSVYELVQIAKKVLKAEINCKEKNYDISVKLFQEAILIEDQLNYNEPPDWFFSVRHDLGAVQLKAGYYEDAIKTYTKDLEKLPKNGWALKGLVIAHTKLNDTFNTKKAEERFNEAWATADVALGSSIIY